MRSSICRTALTFTSPCSKRSSANRIARCSANCTSTDSSGLAIRRLRRQTRDRLLQLVLRASRQLRHLRLKRTGRSQAALPSRPSVQSSSAHPECRRSSSSFGSPRAQPHHHRRTPQRTRRAYRLQRSTVISAARSSCPAPPAPPVSVASGPVCPHGYRRLVTAPGHHRRRLPTLPAICAVPYPDPPFQFPGPLVPVPRRPSPASSTPRPCAAAINSSNLCGSFSHYRELVLILAQRSNRQLRGHAGFLQP